MHALTEHIVVTRKLDELRDLVDDIVDDLDLVDHAELQACGTQLQNTLSEAHHTVLALARLSAEHNDQQQQLPPAE